MKPRRFRHESRHIAWASILTVCAFCVPFLVARGQAPPKAELKEPPLLTCPATATEVKRSQQAWADYLKVKVFTEENLGNGVKLKMVLIPPGMFRMGSTDAEVDRLFEDFPFAKQTNSDHEKPSREVTISKAFYMGMYEVSRGEFRKFVDADQYQTEAESDGTGSIGWDAESKEFRKEKSCIWKNTGYPQTDDHPVVVVTWNDAQAFCKWMSKRTKRKVILASEAQWEYACRAGSEDRYSFGDRSELLAKNANSADGNAKKVFPDWKTIEAEDGYVFTAPVRKFKPNSFGLHDMHGNVWEWCEDWDGPYEGLPLKDPLRKEKFSLAFTAPVGRFKSNAPGLHDLLSNAREWHEDFYGRSEGLPLKDSLCKEEHSAGQVLRGGSWSNIPVSCRSARRNAGITDSDRSDYIGFRVCFRLD